MVYVIWGSTYLTIKFADETLPPFLMAGVRFLIAGALLYVCVRATGAARPTFKQWRGAGIVGILLLAGGNGTVTYVEQQGVASGVAALLVALVPIWMVALGWLALRGARPSGRTLMGLGLGLVGVALLSLHGGGAGGSALNPTAFLLVLSSGVWAYGSLLAKRVDMPASPLMTTAVEMLVGGAALLVMALVSGEPATLSLHTVSMRSLLSLGYLIIFGSIAAYTAYTWLLREASPALVSTYAYVNPVVAVLLGWAFDNEQLTGWTVLAAGVIVAGVVLITLPSRGKRGGAAQSESVAGAEAAPNAAVGRVE